MTSSLATSREPAPSSPARHPLTPAEMPDGYGVDPGPHAPRYVQACYRSLWTLWTWPKFSPRDREKRCARCFSWRHEGPCQRSKAAQDYSRLRETLEPLPRERLSYAVLTLDPSAWTGAGWIGPAAKRRPDAVRDLGAIARTYVQLCANWTQLIKRLRARFGLLEYVATVECHRSGWPHMNVVLYARESKSTLAAALLAAHEALPTYSRKAAGREAARRVFGDLLVLSGFGPIAFIEPAKPLDADGGDPLAGYMAKLAAMVQTPFEGKQAGGLVDSIEGRTVAEIVKFSQVPYDAPPSFRRLRASKGFLVPKRTNPDITGEIKTHAGRRLGKHPVDDLIARCGKVGPFGAPAQKAQLESDIGAFQRGRAFPLGETDTANLAHAVQGMRGEWPDPATLELVPHSVIGTGDV